MENILLPSKVHFEPGSHEFESVLIVEPCFHGYGTTLGNALRRVLLSSMVGAAVTAVKIKGVTHEFQAIENVKEDALQIILNLKGLRLKMHTEGPVTLSIKTSGVKDVTAADIEASSDVEIISTDLHIASVTDPKADFEMELTVQRGRGFAPTEERDTSDADIGTIAIDAIYSPIRNVSYRVEPTRVGDITNYDKLLLTIETDGTITAEQAVADSTKILMDNFNVIASMVGAEPQTLEVPAEEEVVEETTTEEVTE